MLDDMQIVVLTVGIETDPEPEALGEGNFFFHHFAGVDLAILEMLVAQVLLQILGHEMPPVGGGVDQHVVGSRADRAIEHRLERLVARLAFLERQIVAEHDETLGTICEQVGEFGQIDQIGLVHLDETQPLAREFVQTGLDQGRFARAARAGDEYIVSRLALHELAGIALDLAALIFDTDQIVVSDGRELVHGHQLLAPALADPAKGDRRRPVGLGQRSGQQRFQPIEQAVGSLKQRGKLAAQINGHWRIGTGCIHFNAGLGAGRLAAGSGLGRHGFQER